MKAVAHFDVDLSRLGEVCSAKCIGTVQQEPTVGQRSGIPADGQLETSKFEVEIRWAELTH